MPTPPVVTRDARRRIILGQLRPGDTNAAAIYTPDNAKMKGNITSIVVAASATANYSIFHDDDGTTYDQSTALFYVVNLAIGNTEIITFGDDGFAVQSGGNLGVQLDTASAMNFTVYGFEESVL